eukprot:jgi/Bigna1/71957/fgenesh1_pg.17_\
MANILSLSLSLSLSLFLSLFLTPSPSLPVSTRLFLPACLFPYTKTRFTLKTTNDKGDKTAKIDQHDALFWLGDLNYRYLAQQWLNFGSENLGQVYQLIAQEEWDQLLEQDQLRTERIKGLVDRYHEQQ